MQVRNWQVKDIIFSSDERRKVGAHVQRMLRQGWEEFAGHVDENGLAQGEPYVDDDDDIEVIQLHKSITTK